MIERIFMLINFTFRILQLQIFVYKSFIKFFMQFFNIFFPMKNIFFIVLTFNVRILTHQFSFRACNISGERVVEDIKVSSSSTCTVPSLSSCPKDFISKFIGLQLKQQIQYVILKQPNIIGNITRKKRSILAQRFLFIC